MKLEVHKIFKYSLYTFSNVLPALAWREKIVLINFVRPYAGLTRKDLLRTSKLLATVVKTEAAELM